MRAKITKMLASAIVVAGVAGFAPAALAASCDTDRKIDIAEMNWPSAAALAHIHATILEKGYGCNVEVVAGDTVPTSASMLAKGRPAIAPEMWTGTIQEAWDKGIADGAVKPAGLAISDGAVEGWWIPKYVADANPDLKKVEDLPAHKDLFKDPDDPSQGRFYSCPPGWGCEIANAALFEAYELEESFNLFSPGSGGNLDASIIRAFEREQPIVFYYWGPTAIMGKYDMVQLEMPAYDAEVWNCNTDSACTPKRKSAFATPPVVVATSSWLSEEAPMVFEYLGKVSLNNVQISQMLNWGAENKAGAKETAENFLKTEQDVWTSWVDAETAEKIKSAL
ncbi:ABC transporter substrate-binding protein [Maritalea porphyrae]|uniref:ABC transporter substrate-binding protein n=1 Tax=Maritalea porphyrae TaxID=880732 RepID=A0ABQ5UN82_9HYPH|nr:ABC transporter substrate-binding protein [Maritalea porphyrae]GLQ16617.1 ABC transporter substrate-binding protein [Maritalea porphyrae]